MRFLSYVSSKNHTFPVHLTASATDVWFSQYTPKHRSAGTPRSELHFRLVKKIDNFYKVKFIYIMMAEILAPKTTLA